MSALIADIGGTNARFATVGADGAVENIDVFACADYASLTDAAKAYLGKYEHTAAHAVFAVAAPILGDEIKMPNHTWVMSQKKIKSDMGFKSLRVINDFAAVAHGVPLLSPEDYYQIGEGAAQKGAPVGIIGPGTGLGVAAVVFDERGRAIPVTTEGGHVTMCANTQREWNIIAELKREKYHHVSAERLVSGKGIVNLYQAICALDGIKPDKADPSDITKAGLDRSCPACVEALDLFADLLGTLAGNVALSLGAFGGVYIAGGIVTKLGDWFKTSRFRESFMNKGRSRDYLARIPTFVITHPYPGFVGLQGLATEAARC
ncbi:MAG: glucokinase [Alphaproteobacteria bacterium]|nr:glucokinase [Alphaproteobacteria bacterium]MDE2336131.1 glucokinase [Alphaproteobacteria bacterium]